MQEVRDRAHAFALFEDTRVINASDKPSRRKAPRPNHLT
jgi:hypothetical protein